MLFPNYKLIMKDQQKINKLKYLRLKNNITQKQIADILSISQPNYVLYETGKIKMNIDYLKLLANYYKVPMSYLLKNDNCLILNKDEYDSLKSLNKIIESISKKTN